MFDLLFDQSHALMRHVSGPLVQERRGYLSYCSKQGMARTTLRRVSVKLLDMVEYLNLSDGSQEQFTLDQVDKAADLWADRHPNPLSMQGAGVSKRRFVALATRWLVFLNRMQPACLPAGKYDSQIADFAKFMEEELGLSPATIRQRCSTVRQFLDQHCASDRPLNALTVSDVDAALAHMVNKQEYARVTVRTVAASLRAFFRYAQTQGWCSHGLASSIMAPRAFSQESLP
jgi:hypothetical protein